MPNKNIWFTWIYSVAFKAVRLWQCVCTGSFKLVAYPQRKVSSCSISPWKVSCWNPHTEVLGNLSRCFDMPLTKKRKTCILHLCLCMHLHIIKIQIKNFGKSFFSNILNWQRLIPLCYRTGIFFSVQHNTSLHVWAFIENRTLWNIVIYHNLLQNHWNNGCSIFKELP